MLKVINDYSNMPDAELLTKATNIHSGISKNPSYPNPPVKMDALLAETQLFSDSLVGADSRDKVKVAIKNKIRKALIAMLNQLLPYVNLTANGDKAVLLSSGFTLGKETGEDYELGVFEKLKATQGKNSGEVDVRYNKVDGAVSYEIEFAETPVANNNWGLVRTTYVSEVIKGLIRGKEYDIRVRAVGRGGLTTTSDPIRIVVN